MVWVEECGFVGLYVLEKMYVLISRSMLWFGGELLDWYCCCYDLVVVLVVVVVVMMWLCVGIGVCLVVVYDLILLVK